MPSVWQVTDTGKDIYCYIVRQEDTNMDPCLQDGSRMPTVWPTTDIGNDILLHSKAGGHK